MRVPERIAEAAVERIIAAANTIEESRRNIDEGVPLRAEKDRDRAIDRVATVANVNRRIAEQIVEEKDPASLGLTGESLRRAEVIQGKTADYIGVGWLEAGKLASNSVARVVLRDGTPLGSGFLISSRLFITNNHVIQSKAGAKNVYVEFGYEIRFGAQAASPVRFELDPDSFFITDDENDLDYTVVSIGRSLSAGGNLREFGCSPLSASSAKHSVGEPVNIIQHPDGDYKQVVIRENRIVHRGDNVLHYIADTEPGSSGSPVFNDLWQVVALHHWGTPHRQTSADGRRLGTDVNEGIRISAIVRELEAAAPSLTANQRNLLKEALTAPPQSDFGTRVVVLSSFSGPQSLRSDPFPSIDIDTESDMNSVVAMDGAMEAGGAPASRIDRRYSNRRGYNERFLNGLPLPMPQLSAAQRRVAARVRGMGESDNPFELQYEHFSVVINSKRRMAFYSICNINGAKRVKVNRDTGRAVSSEATETWAIDPRVPPEAQLSDAFYARIRRDLRIPADFFARGHLTRREDPNWGSEDAAERANDDTYHHTNACPQAQNAFNGSRTVWQGLENFILNSTDDSNLKVTVITGPVFDDENDPVYEDDEFGPVQFPSRFWKIVARVEDGTPKVFAVLADQSVVMERLFSVWRSQREAAFDWPTNLNEEYRSTVAEIASLTGLDFGDLVNYDVFAGAGESLAARPIRIRSPLDLFPEGMPRPGQFGEYASMGAFLEQWEKTLREPGVEGEAGESAAERRRRPQPPRARRRKVIDIQASVARVFADDLSGSKHQQFTIVPTKWGSGDDSAKAEVQALIRSGGEVRVAVRFGDSRGLADRIPGVRRDAPLHIKGEWISAKDAYDVGGEDIPVLHFTHDPLGFICTEVECYS